MGAEPATLAMDSNGRDVQVGSGYPVGQLATAFVTAVTHEDPATRDRAQERARRWSAVLAGMASGRLTIGSRTPVQGVPAWVTPEVVRGGFATGTPAAGDPRPLPMIKDIAYAWRHMIFYLSALGGADPHTIIDQLHTDLANMPDPVRERLTPALIGLGYVAAGGRFTDDRTPAGGRRLLGWTTGRHWLHDTVATR